MPRLSLYKPERGKDYEFLDRQILEMFTVGGTDVNVHKYLGPKEIETAQATADVPKYDVIAETNIQDLLFLENRDRSFLIIFYPNGRNSGLEFRVLDQNQKIYYDIFGELNET